MISINHILKVSRWAIRKKVIDIYPKAVIDIIWQKTYGYKIDWDNPRDINEKIQWLICFGDTSKWPYLADKYLVRDYVAQNGYAHILPNIYGHWDDATNIDFDSLPDQFILKCNHDSNSWHKIDKSKGYNKKEIVESLNYHLKRKWGYVNCEPHYNKIKPLIIAEQLLESKQDTFSSSLVDYKVWCFDGKPYSIWVCYNREHHWAYVNSYDLSWRVHPEHSIFTDHYRNGKGVVPKPEKLNEMLEAASALSKGLPEARIDFYIVDNRLYFGEITLTSMYGRMDFYTKDYLVELGNQIVLPKKTYRFFK